MIRSRRPLVNIAVIALVAVFGVSSCTSDPSARRVAEDIVNTETRDQPEVQDCMLKVIADYDDRFGLDDLGNDANSGTRDVADPAKATLAEFEAALAACR